MSDAPYSAAPVPASKGALAEYRPASTAVGFPRAIEMARRHITPPILVALCLATFLATLSIGWFLIE